MFVDKVDILAFLELFWYILSDYKIPIISPCDMSVTIKFSGWSLDVAAHWSWISFTGLLETFETRMLDSFTDWAW